MLIIHQEGRTEIDTKACRQDSRNTHKVRAHSSPVYFLVFIFIHLTVLFFCKYSLSHHEISLKDFQKSVSMLLGTVGREHGGIGR